MPAAALAMSVKPKSAATSAIDEAHFSMATSLPPRPPLNPAQIDRTKFGRACEALRLQ